MAQFSLYRNDDSRSNQAYPYLIDVQHDLLSELNSRLVIPLASYLELNNSAAKKLCPIITLDTGSYVLLTQQMTSVPKATLRTELTSLENFRYEILAAIDMLIAGI